VTEIKSGAAPSYDLMFQNVVTGIPIYTNAAFEPVPWLDLAADLKSQDLALNGAALIVDTQFIVPTYNPRIIKEGDVPKTWDDLLDPKWKGKLGLLVNNEPWDLLAQPSAWGRERTISYLKKLMELNPKIGRLPEAHQRVLSGETPLNTFGQYERAVHYRDDLKAPISAIATVEPVLTYVYIFMIPKGAKSRHAAALVAAAMLSDEGQAIHRKFRSASSMFRPGTPSNEFAKTHKIVTPQLDFLLSAEFADLNKEISGLISERR
jgi:iron(III) transport system substrate-binding protein